MSISPARLRVVRDRLLKLHKVLLDEERARYERTHGSVRSSGEWLQLVIGHEQFAWLRQFSTLIVRIDTYLAADRPTDDPNALWAEAQQLTTLSDHLDDSPAGRYRQLVDSMPAAAVAHASVRDALSDA
jgi:hypothetical protein